jgi:hypothetical protein
VSNKERERMPFTEFWNSVVEETRCCRAIERQIWLKEVAEGEQMGKEERKRPAIGSLSLRGREIEKRREYYRRSQRKTSVQRL